MHFPLVLRQAFCIVSLNTIAAVGSCTLLRGVCSSTTPSGILKECIIVGLYNKWSTGVTRMILDSRCMAVQGVTKTSTTDRGWYDPNASDTITLWTPCAYTSARHKKQQEGKEINSSIRKKEKRKKRKKGKKNKRKNRVKWAKGKDRARTS